MRNQAAGMLSLLAAVSLFNCGGGTKNSAIYQQPAGVNSSSQINSATLSDVGKSSSANSQANTSASVKSSKTLYKTIGVDGVLRSFILYTPSNLNDSEKAPLVFDFHGLFGKGKDQLDGSGFKELAEAEKFRVVYPDGIDNAWNIGPCCTFSREVDDVKFVRSILSQLQAEYAIDSSRIYAVGFSNGGGMTFRLACDADDIFAAVAPAAFDLLSENAGSCKPTKAIPILITRGLADDFVPYAGGASKPPNGLATTIHFLGAEETFRKWQEIDGCQGKKIRWMNNECEVYTDCANSASVGLCRIKGGGHSPGNASTMWDFLKANVK